MVTQTENQISPNRLSTAAADFFPYQSSWANEPTCSTLVIDNDLEHPESSRLQNREDWPVSNETVVRHGLGTGGGSKRWLGRLCGRHSNGLLRGKSRCKCTLVGQVGGSPEGFAAQLLHESAQVGADAMFTQTHETPRMGLAGGKMFSNGSSCRFQAVAILRRVMEAAKRIHPSMADDQDDNTKE